ncbi:MAG TPA: DUF5723 family protein [Salegentibacter sp.]|uniref:DUF5723 family protein n=1 Tax=Salegentibacter sp. TaxID=1903072 RepID=UPI002F93EE8D
MRCWPFITFLFGFSLLSAQNKPLLYNVDDLPQSLMLNPGAQIDYKGHVGLPFLSQIHFSAGTSGVSLHDIFRDDGTNINSRIREAMHSMTSYDHFTVNEQVEVISLGWQLDKRNYLSTGIYQELDFFSYFPKDLAILVNEGNANYINDIFDFSEAAFTGEIMAVYHLGLNHRFDQRLTVGIRGKLYSGIFNAESTGNTGTFTTVATPEGPNKYRHIVENMDVQVNTSGFASLNEEEGMTVEEGTAELLKRSFFGGNVGVGMDLGLSYLVTEQFVASASVQDIGVMFQRENVESYHYYGSYQTDGLEPLFPDLDETGRAIPYWDDFEDEVDKNLIDRTYNDPYVTWRPAKFNLAIEYGFGQAFLPCNYLVVNKVRYMNQIGMNLAGVLRPRGLVYSFTTYWDKKLTEKQRFRIAHTLDDYSLANFGLMYSVTFNKFNLYLAANNILGFRDLAKARSTSVQLGMQMVFKDL